MTTECRGINHENDWIVVVVTKAEKEEKEWEGNGEKSHSINRHEGGGRGREEAKGKKQRHWGSVSSDEKGGHSIFAGADCRC